MCKILSRMSEVNNSRFFPNWYRYRTSACSTRDPSVTSHLMPSKKRMMPLTSSPTSQFTRLQSCRTVWPQTLLNRNPINYLNFPTLQQLKSIPASKLLPIRTLLRPLRKHRPTSHQRRLTPTCAAPSPSSLVPNSTGEVMPRN